MPLSDIEKHVGALQWLQLTDFGRFAGPRLRGAPVSLDPEGAARQYLSYLHQFGPAEWQQISDYRARYPERMTVKASVPSEDVPEYEISSVAMQYRMIFGFAAQFTVYADTLATAYLRDHHGLSGDEWEEVLAFLEAQGE